MSAELNECKSVLHNKKRTCVHMLFDDEKLSMMRLVNAGDRYNCRPGCRHIFIKHVGQICCAGSGEKL